MGIHSKIRSTFQVIHLIELDASVVIVSILHTSEAEAASASDDVRDGDRLEPEPDQSLDSVLVVGFIYDTLSERGRADLTRFGSPFSHVGISSESVGSRRS